MAEETCPPVSVSRTIDAPAEKLFALLAQPSIHPDIDGSGMVRAATSGSPISGVGDVFVMEMHNEEMGDYTMANHVVDFEPDRRIGWEPVLQAASRAEDEAGIGDRAEVRWAYELTPLDAGSTVVTETFDCSRSPEWLRTAVKGGQRWVDAMTASLERLDVLSHE